MTKKTIALIIAVILLLFFTACNSKSGGAGSTLEVVRTVYEYEKSNWSFKFHLENVGSPVRISNLVNKLIYNNLSFDEYVSNMEKGVMESMDDYELADPRSSYLNEKYSIKYADTHYIVISYHYEEFYGFAPHPNYQFKCFIIDVSEERSLNVDDILKPIPEKTLLDLIKKQYGEDVDIGIDDFSRDVIWPPDLIYIDGKNTALIWNTYTLLPHAYGPVEVIDNKIITKYLTAKGKEIIKLDTAAAPQAQTETISTSPLQSAAKTDHVFESEDGSGTNTLNNGAWSLSEQAREVELFLPGEDAIGFERVRRLTDGTPEDIVSLLARHVDLLPNDAALLSFTVNGKSGHADMNAAYGNAIRSTGTTGERYMVSTLVNTLITFYGLEEITLTVEGSVIETGHATIDGPNRFWDGY